MHASSEIERNLWIAAYNFVILTSNLTTTLLREETKIRSITPDTDFKEVKIVHMKHNSETLNNRNIKL